ncbi:MAG: NADH-quinone oxidoreductase subunit D [Chloroflexi bacterium]|nr:NADH-quinone oxidoreductase subunit D [Chloroflexota bacterium]
MPVEHDLRTVDMLLNMGPQHPSTHGVFRMVLRIDGERVTDVEPHIGYLHRGSEKLCERENYRQIVTLFDRLDYLSNFNNELGFVMAAEKLMGIEAPERAQFIRVILCELNRISSHMMFYGAYGADVGVFGTSFMYGFRERETIQQLFESVTGARMMHSYFRVGGVFQDTPDGFEAAAGKLLSQLKRSVEECDRLLTKNEIFLERTRGVGAISAADAVDYGMSGPCLRACGVAQDVRLIEPYLTYNRFDWDIPLGKKGDCWDRYWVRLEEVRQSIAIIEQALKLMPKGPIQAPVAKFGFVKPPVGEAYFRAENPRGEFGVYLVSDGKTSPYRVKIRGPSFVNLMALRQMTVGHYIADAVVILGSLDIVLGEVDR